ncbi:hypothetical protein DL93DRAFT_2226413 [Clavulina sp. PMI_390]|nr:hypothetical protein DL93DRAFT_2226413 [Clavulina sp. PMI_390]
MTTTVADKLNGNAEPHRPQHVLSHLIRDAPIEILICILSQLEGRDIAHCQLVSKSLYRMISDSKLLQYIMTLAMADYVEDPKNRSAISSSFNKTVALREHLDAWYRMRPSSVDSMEFGPAVLTELRGGVLAITSNTRVNITILPSRLRGIRTKSTISYELDEPPVQTSILPEEDLLVAFHWSAVTDTHWSLMARFLRLSTSKPHHLAPKPILFKLTAARPVFTRTLFRSTLALSYLNVNPEGFFGCTIEVMDWKKGTRLGSMFLPNIYYLVHPTFLTPTVLLIPRQNEVPISLPGHPNTPFDRLDLYTIVKGFFCPLASFSLPEMALPGYVTAVSLTASAPSTPSAPYSTIPPPAFSIDDDERIVIIRQMVFGADSQNQAFFLIRYVDVSYPVRHFIRLAGALMKSIRHQVPLSFEAWGGDRFRLKLYSSLAAAPLVSFGSRVVTIKPEDKQIHLLDHRQHIEYWHKNRPISDLRDVSLTRSMTNGGLKHRASDFATSLPFLSVKRSFTNFLSKKYPVTDILHDLEHIVIVQKCVCEKHSDPGPHFVILSF